MISLSTTPGGSPVSRWWIAVCSESIGISRAPVASASAVTSSPPTTSDSLLASATSMPSVSATIVGPRPARADDAVEHEVGLRLRDEPDQALGAGEHLALRPRPRRRWRRRRGRSARSGVTPCSIACLTSGTCWRPADSPTTSNAPCARLTTSSAWVPIEPVEPRMRSRFTGAHCGSGWSQGFIRSRRWIQALPVVFLHGLFVDGSLWDRRWSRACPTGECVVLELPLGSHTEPVRGSVAADADRRRRLIADEIRARGLSGVTLVGNDTGGGLAQLVVVRHPELVGQARADAVRRAGGLPARAVQADVQARPLPAAAVGVPAADALRARAPAADRVRLADQAGPARAAHGLGHGRRCTTARSCATPPTSPATPTRACCSTRRRSCARSRARS